MPTIRLLRSERKGVPSDKRKERIKIYSSEKWKHLRQVKLYNSPLCERCLKMGKTVPADDVHHVVSFMSVDDPYERRRLAYDYDNLMSLCRACHNDLHNANRGLQARFCPGVKNF